MDDHYYEDRINDLAEQTRSVALGYKMLALSLLIIFSLINVSDTFAISQSRLFYRDTLGPDHPFSSLTNIFLGFQALVTCLAILWPILGILAATKFKKVSSVLIILSILLIVVIAQIALTWIGLNLPMFDGLTTGK